MPMLGTLMLETRFARLPGGIGHPSTFAFAVRRRVVRVATPARVVRGGDRALLQPFVDAAGEFVAEGCTAMATRCGFLARWQRELQAALPVPVWSTALLQQAELQARGRRCGVITIEAASLQAAHFEVVGPDPAPPVEGITPGSALHRALDETDAQRQVQAAAQRLLARAAHRHAGARTHQPAALCAGAARSLRAAGAGRGDVAELAHGLSRSQPCVERLRAPSSNAAASPRTCASATSR